MSSSVNGIVATDSSYKSKLFELRSVINEALLTVSAAGPGRFFKLAGQTAKYEITSGGGLVVTFRTANKRRVMHVFLDSQDKSKKLVQLAGPTSIQFSLGDDEEGRQLVKLMLEQFPQFNRWLEPSDLLDEDSIIHMPKQENK